MQKKKEKEEKREKKEWERHKNEKRGASEGGTTYIIRGAWGLGAYKGVAERRLTGARKYAPKGNGKDEKEKKERAKGKRKREKERKGRKEDH